MPARPSGRRCRGGRNELEPAAIPFSATPIQLFPSRGRAAHGMCFQAGGMATVWIEAEETAAADLQEDAAAGEAVSAPQRPHPRRCAAGPRRDRVAVKAHRPLPPLRPTPRSPRKHRRAAAAAPRQHLGAWRQLAARAKRDHGGEVAVGRDNRPPHRAAHVRAPRRVVRPRQSVWPPPRARSQHLRRGRIGPGPREARSPLHGP